jgi:hypothetical protein
MAPYKDNRGPTPDVVLIERMSGEDDGETALLRKMFEEAKAYILSFSWCDSIISAHFAGEVGKVFAIFLFNINSNRPDVDPWEWVFVGDAPPAYLPLEDAPSKMAAFETYLEGMGRWVAAARQRREPQPEDRCPPVNLPSTPESTESLDIRLRTLSEVIRPFFE